MRVASDSTPRTTSTWALVSNEERVVEAVGVEAPLHVQIGRPFLRGGEGFDPGGEGCGEPAAGPLQDLLDGCFDLAQVPATAHSRVPELAGKGDTLVNEVLRGLV